MFVFVLGSKNLPPMLLSLLSKQCLTGCVGSFNICISFLYSLFSCKVLKLSSGFPTTGTAFFTIFSNLPLSNFEIFPPQQTRHVLFCGPPSFVLTHNKCILSFAIFPRAKTENKTVVFIFSWFFTVFFKIMQSKQRQIWSYYHLSSTTQTQVAASKSG